jgi:1-deoxy-D-xylulose-5-phosphate synthase
MVLPALAAAELLAARGDRRTVVNCRFIKPLDEAMPRALFPAHRLRADHRGGDGRQRVRCLRARRIAETSGRACGRLDGAARRLRGARRAGELLAELGLTPDGDRRSARALLAEKSTGTLRETA